MKSLLESLQDLCESFRPATQFLITLFSWAIGQIGTVTAILALIVLAYQLRVVYYTGKLRKLECDKACKGDEE